MKSLRMVCVQMDASGDFLANLEKAGAFFHAAVRKKAQCVAFPENFLWRGPSSQLSGIAKNFSPTIQHFQQKAKESRTAVLLGSLIENASGGKFFNTSVLINEKGQIAARYRKIHLFRIGLRQIKTDEARSLQPGALPCLGKIFKIPAGLSICYDLRFPELYRRYGAAGAPLIFAPSNFTAVTGKAHWEILVRARAIENQAFLIAPAQAGKHSANGILSYGHTLIVDPWGRILAQGSASQEEILFADLDFSSQKKLRKQFPVLSHRVL